MNNLANFNDKLRLAVENHNNKKLDIAEKLYNELLTIQPNNPQIIFYFATLLAQQNKLDTAKNYFKKLSKKSPNDPNVNTNLGNIYFQTGDFKNAIKYFNKVIEQKPDFVQAYFNKGILLNNLRNYKDALECFKKVFEIEPNNNIALNIICSILVELGEFKKSIIFLKKILNDDPNNITATNTLVNIFKTVQLSNLTDKSIKEFKKLFIFLFKKNSINHNELFNNAKILFHKVIDLKEADHINLSNSLVKDTLNNELFQLMLQKSLFRDVSLENFLFIIRKEILLSLNNKKQDELISFLNFIISLAEQSFLNEYVIYQSEEEVNLKNKLKVKISEDKEINELEVSVLACYTPLYKNKKICDKLIKYRSKNNLFNDLIKLQIKEPLTEKIIKTSLKSLEIISDKVSIKVKDQYEVNPYPRWRYGNNNKITDFASILSYDIGPNRIDLKNKFFSPNILVAGCGTGAQLQSVAYRKNAKILAFDLSFSSLAYAKRKTEESGFKNIEFLQGDILNLNKLNKKFDIIECVGVLHHMKEPLDGLKTLINLIEPNGVLKLGLYSEIAREQIIKTRQFIEKEKLSNNIQDIRNCREMIKSHKDELIQRIVNRYDFYSTSSTRDLIFHVQEHRFTIPQICGILKKFNLEFLGFTNPNIKKKYINAFPNDKKCTSLKNWHEFEKKNKEIFIGMYNFWVRKN